VYRSVATRRVAMTRAMRIIMEVPRTSHGPPSAGIQEKVCR
jgi:hypothetical protein